MGSDNYTPLSTRHSRSHSHSHSHSMRAGGGPSHWEYCLHLAVPVCSVRRRLAARSPLQAYNPGNDFQEHRCGAQDGDHDDVGRLPFPIRLQYGEAFEDVDDPQYDDGVAHRVVVGVPVDAILVLRLGPQE